MHLTLRKCCACHAIQSLRNLRVAVPLGPRFEHGPNALRTRSESGPTRRREQASFRLSGDTNSRTGPCFLQLSTLPPHARTYFLARLFLLYSSVSARAGFQLVAVTRKFLLNFLWLKILLIINLPTKHFLSFVSGASGSGGQVLEVPLELVLCKLCCNCGPPFSGCNIA